ncbi:MAG: HAD-IA family hydrolase [Lachnospiraceae bacterium]|nr:HAD-IA family hydrolase [Lachnospiraceae bacterium]
MIKAVIFDMYETLVTQNRGPLYFGEHIAADMGISEAKFREIWDVTDDDRTLGKLTLRETIDMILKANDIYTKELSDKIVTKRSEIKKQHFRDFRDDIIPMLEGIKKLGIKIALISNCYEEEVPAIRESSIFPYFDVAMLSYEQGVMKPDQEIYERAVKALNVAAEECLYVGDGGSHELEAALEAGMKPMQARWYLAENTRKPPKPKAGFEGFDRPEELTAFLMS